MQTRNYRLLAKKTLGFVGANVQSLLKKVVVIASNCIFLMGLLGSGIGRGGVDGIASCSTDAQQAKGKGASAHPTIGGTSEEETNNGNGLHAAITGDKQSMIKDGECGLRNGIRSIIPLTPEQLRPFYVTISNFLLAIPHVQPSLERNGFVTVFIEKKNALMRKIAKLDAEDANANANKTTPPIPTPV